MSGWSVMAAGLMALGAAAVAGVIAAVVAALVRPGPGAVRRTANRVLACRLAGMATGLVAAMTIASGPGSWLGLGVVLAAPTFAGCVLAGVLVGEIVATGRPGTTRIAALEVRNVRSYLPPVLTSLVVATGLTLTAFLTVTSFVGTADDQSRPGRLGLGLVALVATCGFASALVMAPRPAAS